jgi:hypothetical protein
MARYNDEYFVFNDEYFDEAFIRDLLAQHPAECVFELDAPQNIVQRLSVKTKREWWRSIEIKFLDGDDEQQRKNLQEFRACWIASEIYCPHEGIDRLAECGVKTLNWETA